MRLLMMFGPMLFRQYKKFQKNKSQETARDDQSQYQDLTPEESTGNTKSYKEKDFV